jgi:2-oxoacid dehydrogenases acyltransferase (catalytic domain)
MKWPLVKRAIPNRQVPLYNRFYLHASAASQLDPILVWGTEIDADALQAFLHERNRNGSILITPAHALIRATALALEQFPEMNVRLVGRRIYAFRDVNIRMAFFHRRNSEMDLLIISDANLKSLERIALEIWQRLLQAGRGEGGRDRDLARFRRIPVFWFRQIMRLYGFLDRHVRLPTFGRLDGTRASCVMVNDLSFPGAPPMRIYKPTRFPDKSDSLNLTLGPIENKVVARSDKFVSVNVMPLFLRADHRLADAQQVGRFLAAVRDLLSNPERLGGGYSDQSELDRLSDAKKELR